MRSRDFPACITVPQPLRYRVPLKYINLTILIFVYYIHLLHVSTQPDHPQAIFMLMYYSYRNVFLMWNHIKVKVVPVLN
jgi:hypothetical protein